MKTPLTALCALALAAGAASAPAAAAAPASQEPGAKVYADVCAVCHMPDGSGVPNMQPPLKGSGMLAGDAVALIRLVLFGGDAVLPDSRPRYENPMPPLEALRDQQIADVLNYARRTFAKPATDIQPTDVAAQRARP